VLPSEGCDILDAGGGTGFYSLPLAAKGHRVTILDLSEKMLELAQRKAERMGLADKVQTIVGDMETIHQPSSSFDAVICHLALCHVRNPLNALKEFSTVLKKGGLLSLVVENKIFFSLVEAYRGNLKETLDRLESRKLHIQLEGLGELLTFGREELLSMLKESGFTPTRVMGLRVLSDYLQHSKAEPDDFPSLRRIETVLSTKDEISNIGRFHFIVSRNQA